MNVLFPLAFRGVPKKERLKKPEEYMELVGVEKETEKRRPKPDVRMPAAESGSCQSFSCKAVDHLWWMKLQETWIQRRQWKYHS